MYREVGGRDAYWRMPIREAQEMELSMMAEDGWRAEQREEQKHEQEEREREMQRRTQGR